MKTTGPHGRPVTLRGVLMLAILVLAAGRGRAENFQLHQQIPEVKLKDGTILHAVTFVSVGGASITGKWDGGRGSIPLGQLPDALRADLVPVAAAKPASAEPTAGRQAPATASGAEPVADPGKLPTEIKLTNGFVMHQAKVISWQADAMTVRYVGGQVLVKMDQISPEQRMAFEAHKVQVYARQARIAAAQAAQRSGLPPPPTEPSADDLKALIQAGIAAHQLVVGMTKAEVYQAIGAPARTAMDERQPNYLYWLYPGRGRDAKGAPCDRIVGFDKGVMDGWKDQ